MAGKQGLRVNARYLQLARFNAGLRVSVAAERAGISAVYLYQLENGTKDRPSAEVLSKLADLYDCDVDLLVDHPDHDGTPGAAARTDPAAAVDGEGQDDALYLTLPPPLRKPKPQRKRRTRPAKGAET
jgi:transcriptional regulator with XRE-family HTH domain